MKTDNVALLGKAEMVPFKVSGLEFSFKRVECSLHTTRTSYVAADIIPSKIYFDDAM